MKLRSLFGLLAVVALAGCDDGGGTADAGTDADLPEPGLVDIPWLSDGEPPIAPSPEHACPEGFRREETDQGLVSCLPWPAEGPADCAGAEAHFPGEPGCARVGTACPAGDWPEDLPSDRPIVYVREGGTGNGSMVTPYGSVGLAVSRAPEGAVVAVAKGTYDGRVDLFSDVTVWGACPEETILTQSVASSMDAVVGAFLGDGELRNVTIRAPGTMGIYVDMGVHVDVRGVVVDGAQGYGVYVTGVDTVLDVEDVVVRDAVLFPDGVNGGVAMQVVDGGRANVRRASFEAFTQTGLVVAFDSVGTFERIAVRDGRGDEGGVRPGLGLASQMGGDTTVTASAFHGNRSGGVLSARDAILRLEDVAIEDSDGGGETVASALESRIGSTLEASFVYVREMAGAAVVGSEDGQLTATDLVVRDTRPVDGSGAGLSAEGEVRFDLERAHFEGNHRGGIVARPGTTLEARDLVVRDTRSSGDRSLGLGVTIFGEATFERAIVETSRLEGAAVSGEGSSLTLRDVVIRDTRGDPDFGFWGRGLEANLGARLVAERLVLERNREVSLFVLDEGTTASLSDVLVRDSLGMECGDACPDGQRYGYGVSARAGGALDLTGFVVTRSRLLGLQVGAEGLITGRRGEVSESTIGINIQEPTFELADRLTDVAFRDNERNVDAESLPLPPTGLGGER